MSCLFDNDGSALFIASLTDHRGPRPAGAGVVPPRRPGLRDGRSRPPDPASAPCWHPHPRILTTGEDDVRLEHIETGYHPLPRSLQSCLAQCSTRSNSLLLRSLSRFSSS